MHSALAAKDGRHPATKLGLTPALAVLPFVCVELALQLRSHVRYGQSVFNVFTAYALLLRQLAWRKNMLQAAITLVLILGRSRSVPALRPSSIANRPRAEGATRIRSCCETCAPAAQRISTARKSFTLVSVGPVISESPSA